jgi:hypothetical protein
MDYWVNGLGLQQVEEKRAGKGGENQRTQRCKKRGANKRGARDKECGDRE